MSGASRWRMTALLSKVFEVELEPYGISIVAQLTPIRKNNYGYIHHISVSLLHVAIQAVCIASKRGGWGRWRGLSS